MIEKWIHNNQLKDTDNIDALLETADLTRQLIHEKNYTGLHTMICYTIENSLYEGFSWIMDLLQEEFEKTRDYNLDDFKCDIGKSIEGFNEFAERLEVDYNVKRHDVEKVYDEHGEVESFFNKFTYKTKYNNIHLISSENFDTRDNDYIQYRLVFIR